MNIIRGKIPSAQKIVIYGPEGIGKSTFAAHFPEPLFIDTEGSTKHMDVARLPAPTSWSMLIDEISNVKKEGPGVFKTLVIDTADWAEQMCAKHVCDKAHKTSIEDFGYGKGYIYLKEEFGRLLNLLEDVIEVGIHVVITAHAKMRKFEQPDEMGTYDRWEMKLDKNVAPLVKEWADMVLFANYKVFTIKDEQTNKNKAQGGKRVIYTSHHPCWDAKNRHSLPPELSLDYSSIAPYLEAAAIAEPVSEKKLTGSGEGQSDVKGIESTESIQSDPSQNAAGGQLILPSITAADDLSFEPPEEVKEPPDYAGIPQALTDLMRSKEVAPIEIQQVVTQKGYFPKDMPIQNYPPDFVQGVLIAAWPQVWAAIEKNRKDDIPF